MIEDPERPTANPYASPATLESGYDGEDESDEAYLRAFLGRDSPYYLGKWRRLQERGSVGFNIAAFFLSIGWMGYRKMYRVAMVFGGIILTLTTLEQLVFSVLNAEPPGSWDVLSNIVIGVISGGFANRWYLNHCKRQINRVREQGLQGEVAKQLLRARGGTSIWSGIGVFVLYMIVGVGTFVLVELIIYGPDAFME